MRSDSGGQMLGAAPWVTWGRCPRVDQDPQLSETRPLRSHHSPQHMQTRSKLHFISTSFKFALHLLQLHTDSLSRPVSSPHSSSSMSSESHKTELSCGFSTSHLKIQGRISSIKEYRGFAKRPNACFMTSTHTHQWRCGSNPGRRRGKEWRRPRP